MIDAKAFNIIELFKAKFKYIKSWKIKFNLYVQCVFGQSIIHCMIMNICKIIKDKCIYMYVYI